MPLAIALLAATLQTQSWEVKKLGVGGESTVTSDNKGSVFVTYHQPCELKISRDWGATFTEKHEYPAGLGDMHIVSYGKDKLHLTFMLNSMDGIQNYYSLDNGKTMKEGSVVKGPYDREWIAVNAKTEEVFFNYSDGYIGGPKSKGIYIEKSTNGGRDFERIGRVDNEVATSYAVDPYLISTPGGKLYAAYATSLDYDTVNSYKFCYSEDNGKTWKGHTLLATTHADWGDTQERWTLGGIASFGENRVVAYYQDYGKLEVDGQSRQPLLTYVRISDDGGKTFGKPTTILPMDELKDAIRSYVQNKKQAINIPIYVQTLPWLAADPNGNFHACFVDNRNGQGEIAGKPYNKWHTRYTYLATGDREFGLSEVVGKDVVSLRPPLDFNSCFADSKYVYITYSEAPNSRSEWDFSGDLYLARKKIGE
ncbi:MAG: sialidase family protein [Fimbriimonadaceae bacterium]